MEELHVCNLGYADSCQRRPRDRMCDAVRFAVRAATLCAEPRESKTSSGRIELQYICERAHRPSEHGTLEFNSVAVKWVRMHSDARVQKMAECFLQVHLERRKAEAGGVA